LGLHRPLQVGHRACGFRALGIGFGFWVWRCFRDVFACVESRYTNAEPTEMDFSYDLDIVLRGVRAAGFDFATLETMFGRGFSSWGADGTPFTILCPSLVMPGAGLVYAWAAEELVLGDGIERVRVRFATRLDIYLTCAFLPLHSGMWPPPTDFNSTFDGATVNGTAVRRSQPETLNPTLCTRF
jgi:hypothetical protein